VSECAVSSSEDPPDQGRAGACASVEEDGEPPAHPRRGTHLFSLTSERASPSNRFSTPQRLPRFPSSPEARAFRRRFFPDATAADWSNWHWQVRHRRNSGDSILISCWSPVREFREQYTYLVLVPGSSGALYGDRGVAMVERGRAPAC
jgi:hypothetical protein